MRQLARMAVAVITVAGAFAASTAMAASSGDGPVALKGEQTIVDESQGKYLMSGSLVGTWNMTAFALHYEGVDGQVAGSGKETFSGCQDADGSGACEAGEPTGTLRFTFVYWATYNPKTKALVKGECVHPIVGGTGNFAKAKGMIHMWDRPSGKTVRTTYTGALQYAAPSTASRTSGSPRSLASRGGPAGCGSTAP